MLLECYKILEKIYKDGAYSGQALNESLNSQSANSGIITKIVYGVLDKDVQLDYCISQLCTRKPDDMVKIVLKIGLYQLLYLSTASYAAVNNTVELTKRLKKPFYSGFVNAVLKKYNTVKLPDVNAPKCSVADLSVIFSRPEWLVRAVMVQYPDCFKQVLEGGGATELTHIRHNSRALPKSEFDKIIAKIEHKQSVLGYYVTHNSLKQIESSNYVRHNSKLFTIQSLGSMLISKLACSENATMVLDACAAPGGKTVFMSELMPNAEIQACDLHPHRVELIKKYARSMCAENVSVALRDATKSFAGFSACFDLVLCDVPCSGSGTILSKPDIMLNRKQCDLSGLTKIQLDILTNCSKYLKSGGRLVYSTCSILEAENDSVVRNFLKLNPTFSMENFEFFKTKSIKTNFGRQLLPHVSGTEGYYAAVLSR